MNKEQIEKRIEEIEEALWYIRMADRLEWTEEQRKFKLQSELRELKEELKKI